MMKVITPMGKTVGIHPLPSPYKGNTHKLAKNLLRKWEELDTICISQEKAELFYELDKNWDAKVVTYRLLSSQGWKWHKPRKND